MTAAAASSVAAQQTDAFKRRFTIRLVIVLVGGMLLDGYILGIVGPVTTTMKDNLGVNSLWEGLLAAAPLIGILVGSPIGGWAGDKFGRKPLFMIDIALFTVASALQFVTHTTVLVMIVRLLMGIAIGCEYSVGWPMLSEFAPTRIRGMLLAATEIAWYVGFMVGYFVGYVLIDFTHVGWRFILGTSTFIAVALFIGRLGMPESPRWLWNNDRKDEARAVVDKYLEPAAMREIEQEEVRPGRFRMLFSNGYWRMTLFVSAFWFCAVTPYFAIATFAGTVLDKYGLANGLAGGVGLSAVATAGVVITTILVEKLGRRVLTVPPQWLCTGVLAVIGLWVGAPPVLVLILFLAFSFFNAGYTALTGVYPVEVYPTELRGIGTGFAAAISRLGAGAGTFLLPIAISSLGTGPSMVIAAFVALAGAAVSQWLCPETKGKTLSETAGSYAH